MPNQLQYEKSPYLLQHKDNPVDWYPWGDEAFRLAKKENKPVFLSIGYATCHWCHVMEHESFEDEEIASSLNDAFINIKVDREERPDIDSTYMTVCQMLNGHGGWPLTLILTPDKEPFFASTYIPKDARSGRIGLRQLIPGVTGMWKHKPEQVSKAVESIKEGYARSQEFKPGDLPGTEALDYAAEQLAARFDNTYGGFGNAPKFPTPHNLMFLLRHWKETGEERFLDAVNQTLTRMRMGGIWDHIGFGFHRYSTDREWLLPHFEKMLYDQALLMQAYTEAWQATKDPLFKQTAYDIAEYVFRDLQGDTPAFYSAEDADSEGEEGKFYVWEMGETAKMLSKEDQAFFAKVFGIKEEGNFEDEATGQLTGKNIAHLSEPLSGKDTEPWERIREQLFKARTARVRPLLDDKILTDWNALMISALAKAGAAFSDPELINKAAEAFQFIKEKLFIGETLYHRFKEDDTAIPGFADDHAFLIQAAIDLYQSTFDAGYLEFAIDLQKIFDEHFHDSSSGGYFFSRDNGELPLGNQKQIYDGAIPSANSVTMNNLIRLSRITGDVTFEEKANQTAKCFSADLIRSGSSITVGMMSLQMIYNDPVEIIIAEGPDAGNTNAFVEYFSREFIPNKVLLFRPESEKDRIYVLSDYISRNQPVEGKTTIYICRNYSCEKPVVDLNALKELI